MMTNEQKERIKLDYLHALSCLWIEVPYSVASDVIDKVKAYVATLEAINQGITICPHCEREYKIGEFTIRYEGESK